MKIKRNNKSMTIDVSNGKLQKKFATGGHLYEFGTEDFSLKPTASNINLSEGTQPTTTTTPNGLHYSNAIDLSVATKGNNSTTPNGLPNGAGSMDLGKGKETTPSTPSKNISASNALSGVSGIIQAGVEGYGKNAQINDMSTTKTEARDLGSKPTNDSSFQSLNQNVADTKLMNGVSFSDVRGGSDGQRFMNTLGSTVNGAASGASMGPYGALAGAVIGLGSGVAGWIAGGPKARREQRRVNNLINHANEEYTTNAANQVYNIQNQTMANQGRNYFAQGGHLFEDGGKAKHVVLQTDYTKPVIDNYGRVVYPFSSGVVVNDKSSGLKPEIGKSGFVEHDVNQTLSGIQFDKNGNVVKNTYKISPSVNDDTRIPITSSPSVLPNGERRKEPYEPTDEQQYYRHKVTADDVDSQDKQMAAGLALASIPFGGWAAAALNVPQALYTWKHRDETSGINQFLDYASVIPGMKFAQALNLSKNPAMIRSARLAARVTQKAHPSDMVIRNKQFAAPVAALQMVHKTGDAQNVLTYPPLVKDWFNRQLIDTRFDNYLDSSVKPLILNKFAEGGHMFAGGTGLPSYPYLSVPQRQWSYSTPHVDYAGRISSFNPYNTGLVDPETGAYQLKPVVIKAKPEPMAARISANAKEEKKAAEQARLEAEEVARVKKNHPMTDSDYDQSSIFNQPTQHPYLYSIAHDGGYSPSQTWQFAKYGMAAALAAPAAIAGAGAIGAAGGIGNVLNAPTIIGGRIASAAGLPAYYGSTAVDAAFAAHGANTLKDLAVKKYNGQSLDANDYANAALAGLEMAPAAPAIVNGMKMIKVPRYLSTDPEYALAAQTPSGQTMYIKPNEYRMLDEAKPGNEAPPEGDGTLASTLKKVKGKTSGLFKREKDPDDDMLRPESSMLGHYLKKTAGGLANAYGKLTDFTPTRLPYINAKRVINTNMNTYLDNDRYYLKEIQNENPVDLSNASRFAKMEYEDAQTMYNAGVRWDDTKGTYDIAKTASDASEQSATPEVSPDVAKKYADLLNHRFDFSLKQVSSGDSKSNFMEGFKPGVGKAGQWNPQKKYANPNDDYESFMRSYLPGYRKFISIEDPYTQKPLLSAGKVMLSGHPIDQFMWKHPYLTRLPIGLVAATAVNGLNNRITNGGWFNTDPNQFETPGVFADKSNASNRVRKITELASVLGPNWIRGIGYPLIAATGIYDKVAPTPFSINQPSIYKTFDNWNVRHNEDQSYPEKNYFQYLDSAKAHNFQEPYPLILLNDSTPMVNKQIIDQDEEMNAYKYTGRDSTAQDTLNQ